MGGNIETGRMEMLSGDAEELRQFAEDHMKRVNRVTPPEQKQARHDAGVPVFKVGETVGLRGMLFRIARVSERGLLLRPQKG